MNGNAVWNRPTRLNQAFKNSNILNALRPPLKGGLFMSANSVGLTVRSEEISPVFNIFTCLD